MCPDVNSCQCSVTVLTLASHGVIYKVVTFRSAFFFSVKFWSLTSRSLSCFQSTLRHLWRSDSSSPPSLCINLQSSHIAQADIFVSEVEETDISPTKGSFPEDELNLSISQPKRYLQRKSNCSLHLKEYKRVFVLRLIINWKKFSYSTPHWFVTL